MLTGSDRCGTEKTFQEIKISCEIEDSLSLFQIKLLAFLKNLDNYLTYSFSKVLHEG